MRLLKDCDNLLPEEYKQEIKERYDLINSMVGTLYPAIVFDEVIKLRKLFYDKYKQFI